MKPTTLSASALQSFYCPARFNAEYIVRAKEPSSPPAALGTCAHSALEDFISNGLHLKDAPVKTLVDLFEHYYWKTFNDDTMYADGVAMIMNWYSQNMPWDVEWTVVSTEKKQTFDIPSNEGKVPFTFILDRLDVKDDGRIVRVKDYKSNFVALTSGELRHNLQARCYAVAAAFMYPEAEEIWVVFDFLRHESIGVRFERHEIRATWEYLVATTNEILASDGTKEVVNDKCRWCIRRFECDELNKHIFVGGPMKTSDLGQLAMQRYRLHSAKKALEDMIADVDEALTDVMEDEGVTQLDTVEAEVLLHAGKRRVVNTQQVANAVGPELVIKYAKLGVGAMDEMLAHEKLTPEEMTAARGSVTQAFNRPSIKVKPKSALQEED